MKQVFQDMRTGATLIEQVPDPRAGRGSVLIRTRCTLVSAGTERMLVEFGRSSLLEKARQQPEKVRQVLDKVIADGLLTTLEAVKSKLDQPLPLGYCNVGVVTEVGESVIDVSAGDRVASNGPHAEQVNVRRNLCVRIPEGVTDEEATFTVIGAIALQGVRLAQPTLGECVVVTGLGLVGLMAVQLLHANGCRVLGVDPDPRKCAIARRFGAEAVELSRGDDPLAVAEIFSRGRGVDAVLITASTQSNEPVSQAARMCRKRGRIVLVGVTGLELKRADFYEKELTFQVSCSYGPGRYDPAYEEQGQDYPVGFVRWTEQRNFEAVLDMIAARRLDVSPLITHRFAFEEAQEAYDLLASGREPYLGILLDYQRRDAFASVPTVQLSSPAVAPRPPGAKAVVAGVIGAGNYAGRVLIPALHAAGVQLRTLVSSGGVTAGYFGRKYGFQQATTDTESVFTDDGINLVVIATRHDTHARLVCRALQAGKHVFVEKPLALTLDELAQIEAAQAATGSHLCVGLNRRFAPLVLKAMQHVRARSGPLAINIMVNAGGLPHGHWTKDRNVGGGRIVGEGCHFIDLARALVGNPIRSLQVVTAMSAARSRIEDISALQLSFEEGSIASIQYLASGHRRFPKERIEIFWDSKVLQIDNFRKLRGWGASVVPAWGFARQDKGHRALIAAFTAAIRGESAAAIPVAELIEVSRWSVRAGNWAFEGEPS